MKKDSEAPRLKVIARAPFHIYYEGPARVVSAINKVGKFDILPGHADFFSVMSAGDVAIETGSDTVNFAIAGGIIGVCDDEVMLLFTMKSNGFLEPKPCPGEAGWLCRGDAQSGAAQAVH